MRTKDGVFLAGVCLTLVAASAALLSCPAMAQGVQALPEAAPVTDLWKFTFAETGGSTSSPPYTVNVELTQYGDLLYGGVIDDRWTGKKERDKISVTILARPGKGTPAPQSGLSARGAFELRRSDSEVWKGEGYFLVPGASVQPSFQAFTLTAKKLPRNSGEQPYGIDWCSLFHFQDLFNYVYANIPVHAIQDCSLSKNGEGYYLFGSQAPGSGGSVAAATVYFPY